MMACGPSQWTIYPTGSPRGKVFPSSSFPLFVGLPATSPGRLVNVHVFGVLGVVLHPSIARKLWQRERERTLPPTPTVGSSSNPPCLSRWLWRKQQLPLCRSAAKILHREAADKMPGTARSIPRPSAMGRNSFYLALKVKIPSVLCMGLVVGFGQVTREAEKI